MLSFWENLGFDPANIAYIFSFIGLMTKDILFLRLLLLSSHTTWFVLGIITGNLTNIVWHAVFISINGWRTGLLLWERRKIELPPDLEGLYQEFFSSFGRKEILNLWNLGESLCADEKLIESGTSPQKLYFIVQGEAEVRVGSQRVGTLKRGQFIGEMSFITGQNASADVVPRPQVCVQAWDAPALRLLQKTKPALGSKIQALIGQDLVKKIAERNLPLETET